MDTPQKKQSSKPASKAESIDRLRQIIFQLEQAMKDCEQDGKRKEIARSLSGAKRVLACLLAAGAEKR